MSKQAKILILILIVIAAGLIFWFVKTNKSVSPPEKESVKVQTPNQPQSSVLPPQAPPVVKEVEKTKLPENFPSSIPIEQGAKITENLNAELPDGRKNAVREFVSKKSEEANYKLYKDFLLQGGYKLLTDVNSAEQKIVDGEKDGIRVRVRVYKDGEGVKVTINYLTK